MFTCLKDVTILTAAAAGRKAAVDEVGFTQNDGT